MGNVSNKILKKILGQEKRNTCSVGANTVQCTVRRRKRGVVAFILSGSKKIRHCIIDCLWSKEIELFQQTLFHIPR